MLRVLLIEDDLADQLLFQRQLKDSEIDAQLDCVTNLSEGIKVCQDTDYAVIFCDYHLPDGTAEDFLENDFITEQNTIIVLTSQVDYRLAIETVKKGAFDFIDKDKLDKLKIQRLVSLAQRNQKEQRLRAELETKLDENYGNTRAILDNSLDGIWLLSKEGHLQIVNTLAKKTIKEFFGLSIKKGERLLDLVPEKFKKNWEDLFEKSLKGETGYSVLDFEVDGLSYVLETRTNPIGKKGQIGGVTFVMREISHRVKAEKRIRENERNFRSIFEGSEVPILLEDLETKTIVDLNSACAELHNYKISEMIGMHIFDTIPKHYLEQSQRNYQLHLLGKLDVLDSLLETSEGKEIPVQISVTEINFENKPTNLIFYQDISVRKDTEKKLEEAKNLAEQSAQFKSQFLANMSHEIRTPLNALIGFSDLLLNTNINEKQKEYLELIQFSGSNLLHIINDILDLSKIEAGKLTIRNEVFNFHDLLKRTVKLYEARANEKNIRIELELDNNIPKWIQSDEVRISQILNNLINNAVKFTNKGAVKIETSALLKDEENFHCQLKVIDTGIGISKNEQSKIFQKFTQVDGSFQRQHQGTGLGLAIVEQLVSLLDGEINVSSIIGEGTTFTLDLPLKASKSIQDSTENKNELPSFKNHKILIVEDNDINILLIEHILQKTECEYAIAKNGLEGIELAKSYSPDIILMDLQMPVMDGYEAAEKILEKTEIPIFAMSAHVLEEEREKCLKIGMSGFIPKPFKIKDLAQIIDSKPTLINKKPAIADFWERINMPKLEELANNDLNFVNELFNIFLINITEDLKSFKASKNDVQKLRSLAHKMKTSFTTFNFEAAALLCEKIELDEFNIDDFNKLVHEGESAIASIEQHSVLLKAYLID